ncbi:uncharacterized protein [Euphorbia lathyris]|uniref:uncharacterized protein n=1 Tax=Euphorbia lathyris TaxID=212925 RepID=UPI0033132ECE
MGDDFVNLNINYGGKFVVGVGGVWQYIGGEVHCISPIDLDKLSRLDILWYVVYLGYTNCGPVYYAINKDPSKYVELTNDLSVLDMMSGKEPYPIPVEGIVEDASSDSDTDSETTDDELYEAEIDDDNGSEQDEEDQEVRQSVKSYRRERSRSNKLVDNNVLDLGEVGTDKKLECYLREGNKYDGLLGGDEEYIASSNVDSFASDDGGEDHETHKRVKRAYRKVHYDPACEEPLWELGMIVKFVYEFREAVAKYVVKRGVDLVFAKNDHHRVRLNAMRSVHGIFWVVWIRRARIFLSRHITQFTSV